MDKNAFTLGFRFFGRIGVDPGYNMVAAITLARASKSVFLWVVTICINETISDCRKKSNKNRSLFVTPSLARDGLSYSTIGRKGKITIALIEFAIGSKASCLLARKDRSAKPIFFRMMQT